MKGALTKSTEKEEIFLATILTCIVIFYMKKNINISCNYTLLDTCIVIQLQNDTQMTGRKCILQFIERMN